MDPSRDDYTRMSDEKLLAHFVPDRAARELLDEYGTLSEVIADVCTPELTAYRGIGEGRARIVAAVREVSARFYERERREVEKITRPAEVYQLLKDMQLLKREQTRGIYLNSRQSVLGVETISLGGIDSAIVQPVPVFRPAVKKAARAVILAHNHPSGDPEPSGDDIKLTARIRKAGRQLGIELLDHVIIGDGDYRSLKKGGHLD